jgi:hypothetical protein
MFNCRVMLMGINADQLVGIVFQNLDSWWVFFQAWGSVSSSISNLNCSLSDFRKLKWTQLESVCKFNFPDVHGVRLNHKEVCMRLYTILQSDTVFRRCYHCMEFSCHSYCVEEHGSKVVIDIGNKYTWIVTPSFGVRRHFTTLGIPKVRPKDRLVALSNAFCAHLH